VKMWILLDVFSFSSSAVMMACLLSSVTCSISVNEMLVKERLTSAWKS